MLQQFLSYYQICYKKYLQNYIFLLILLSVLYTKFNISCLVYFLGDLEILVLSSTIFTNI